METQASRTFLKTNFFFALMALLFILTGILFQLFGVPLKLMFILTQYGVILLPSIVFIRLSGRSLKETLRLKKVRFSVLMMSLLITLLALPLAYMLNFLMTVVLAQGGWLVDHSFSLGTGWSNYFIFVILIAVSPGICEEVFFRGVILSGYEKVMSPKKVMILTGILFGIFHFSLQNLLLPTLLGIIFAWLAMTTDSIYPSMLGHGVFNFIGVSLTFISSQQASVSFEESTAHLKEMSAELIIGILFFGCIAAGFTILMVLAMRFLKKMCYKPEVGDSLHLRGQVMTILAVDDLGLQVSLNGQEKRILYATLKGRQHTYKEKSRYIEGEKTSYVNIVMILVVVLLYIGMNLLRRI